MTPAAPDAAAQDPLSTRYRPRGRHHTATGDPAMAATTFNPLAAALLVAVLASPAAADTPLHSAAGTGDTATLTALLNAGADPNACDSAGFTPLHHAAIHSRPAAVTMLLLAGADPNACDAER